MWKPHADGGKRANQNFLSLIGRQRSHAADEQSLRFDSQAAPRRFPFLCRPYFRYGYAIGNNRNLARRQPRGLNGRRGVLRHSNNPRRGTIAGEGNGAPRERKNNAARCNQGHSAMRSCKPRSGQGMRFIGMDDFHAVP